MQYKIGDRFKYCSSPGKWFIWEIVGYTNSNHRFKAMLVSHWDGDGIGENLGNFSIGIHDEYLGNFSKSQEFNNLYNKLCGKSE